MKHVPLLEVAPFSRKKVESFDGIKKYLSTGNLEANDVMLEEVTYVDKPSRADIIVEEGDVLFAKMINTDKVLHVTANFDGIIVSTGFSVHKPKPNILSNEYLVQFLKNKAFQRQKDKYCTGAIQIAITNNGINKIKIPLPPIFDQIRIAAVLSKADALIAQRKESLHLLDELLKSTFLEMFGDPVRNEKGWGKKNLGDITSLITDGKHGDSLNEENSGYYFISAKDIHDGIIDYSNARQITKKDFEEVHRRTNLCSGDLVVVNTGATIGKIAIATMDERTTKTTFQKSVAVIKPKNDRLISIYLKFLFALRLKDLLKSSSGSAQQNLLLSQMRKIVITLPPLPLQNQFARIVEKVEALKAHYQASLKELENLYGSLSQRAFKGEL